jgi:hypothetical protein
MIAGGGTGHMTHVTRVQGISRLADAEFSSLAGFFLKEYLFNLFRSIFLIFPSFWLFFSSFECITYFLICSFLALFIPTLVLNMF